MKKINMKKNESKIRKAAMAMLSAMFLFVALFATSGNALPTDQVGYGGMMRTGFGLPGTTSGDQQYFLKLDGVEGESMDEMHRGEIDVQSFSWGLSQTGSNAAGSGGGAGKVNVQDISFIAKSSKASPMLFLKVATGQHIKSATLTVRKSGEGPRDYLTITLEDVMVSSYMMGGYDGGMPMDSFSLNYAKIYFEYRPQNADGSLDSAVKVGYDIKKNVKV